MGLNSAGLSASGGGSDGGGGGIDQITSTGLTVDVTDGTGPVTNLEVTSSFGDWIYGSGADGAFSVAAARTITDGVFDGATPGVQYVESATANFTSDDIGQSLCALGSYSFGQIGPIRILSVVSPSQVVVNGLVPNTNPAVTGVTVQIGGFILGGQYTDVTIPLGVTARMAYSTWDLFNGDPDANAGVYSEPILQCTGTFTIDGTLDLTGADAIGTNGGVSLDYCGGCPGGAGSTTTGSNQGTNPSGSGATGPAGGSGGNGSAGNGGVGIDSGTSTFYQVPWTNPVYLLVNQAVNNLGGNTPTGTDPTGAGGGGGGGDGLNSGGGGGEGGQFVLICARHLVHGGANNYALQGGNGAAATAGFAGGGGGGGRGWWATISDDITGIAGTTGTAGTGGAGIGGGTDGGDGSLGPGQLHFLNKMA